MMALLDFNDHEQVIGGRIYSFFCCVNWRFVICVFYHSMYYHFPDEWWIFHKNYGQDVTNSHHLKVINYANVQIAKTKHGKIMFLRMILTMKFQCMVTYIWSMYTRIRTTESKFWYTVTLLHFVFTNCVFQCIYAYQNFVQSIWRSKR